MPATTPLISNATSDRFLFGSFRMTDQGVLFMGSVVTGTGFTYDVETGHPIAGTVEQIEVQSRTEDQILTVHETIPNIGASVLELNTSTEGAARPWFDATDLLPQNTPAASPLTTNGDLHLMTGDILTATDLDSIATATDPAPISKTNPDLDGLDDIVVMLNITADDIKQAENLPVFAPYEVTQLKSATAR